MDFLNEEWHKLDNNHSDSYYDFVSVKSLPKGNNDWLASARGKAVEIGTTLLVHLPDKNHF